MGSQPRVTAWDTTGRVYSHHFAQRPPAHSLPSSQGLGKPETPPSQAAICDIGLSRERQHPHSPSPRPVCSWGSAVGDPSRVWDARRAPPASYLMKKRGTRPTSQAQTSGLARPTLSSPPNRELPSSLGPHTLNPILGTSSQLQPPYPLNPSFPSTSFNGIRVLPLCFCSHAPGLPPPTQPNGSPSAGLCCSKWAWTPGRPHQRGTQRIQGLLNLTQQTST